MKITAESTLADVALRLGMVGIDDVTMHIRNGRYACTGRGPDNIVTMGAGDSIDLAIQQMLHLQADLQMDRLKRFGIGPINGTPCRVAEAI